MQFGLIFCPSTRSSLEGLPARSGGNSKIESNLIILLEKSDPCGQSEGA
jgi:hypothetical protein